MAKVKKAPRPKAAAPKGFRDYFGAEVTERAEMLQKIAGVYHRYGFDALESSAVETVEALGKFLPDVDRPNEGVFAWQEDEDADWLALRYDLTAPLARVYAENRNDLPTPYRRYAMGPVWRNEKPGPGRYRQFYQCDADTVGTASMAADAEICAMLSDTLEAVGIARGDYVVRINNRKVLNGVMEVAGVLDPSDPDAKAHERGIVLRAIDKLDRLGPQGVRALLGEGRKDESGDYTKGAGLSAAAIKAVLGFTTASAPDRGETLRTLEGLVGSSSHGQDGVKELAFIDELLSACGYGPDRAAFDTSIVRGLGYYTGPVFEAELLTPIKDRKGRPVRIGSVGGGGRYDDLVSRFRGQAVPATGFSFGVSRFASALSQLGLIGNESTPPVIICAFDRGLMGQYFQMATELRAIGIKAEVFVGAGNMGKQLKYADNRNAPLAVLMGSDEVARGEVEIKDLLLGSEMAKAITDNKEWRESRPAQQTCARDNFAAHVQSMLESQK